MSRICGYSCEHNKSGICQISVCDKKSNISDKTEVQTFTRYIDPTITELQQENKQLKERIEYLERSNNRREDTILEQRQEISDLDDNWNKLKEYCADSLYFYDGYQREDLETDISIQGILNKMAELERGVSDVED